VTDSVSLKELMDRTFADRDVRVNLALSAAKEAVTKAEAANDRRLDLLNEFRAQQADEARKYALSELVAQSFKALEERVSRTDIALSTLQGRALALTGFGTFFGGIVGALIARLVH